MIGYLDLWATDLIFFNTDLNKKIYFKRSTIFLGSCVLYYDGYKHTNDGDLILHPEFIQVTVSSTDLSMQFFSTKLNQIIWIDPQLMFDIQLGFHPVNALQSLIQRNIERAG